MSQSEVFQYPKFKKLHPEAVIPRRSITDDIGWDLTTRIDRPLAVNPGQFVDIPCDLAVELPDMCWGLLVGRSSTLRKYGLLVHSGVIDTGYRGPLFAGAFNVSGKTVVIENGVRLSQLICIRRADPIAATPLVVDELSVSARAANGFGSTGR